jgi:TIR domain
MAPEHSVFISYRRDDTQFFARLLADRLSARYRVFTDVGTIQPGTDFMEAVRREVSTCDVLLAVIGPQWASLEDETGQPRIHQPQDVVALEIASALQRKIRVIPVLVEQARMPPAEGLPPSLQALATRNGISFRNEAFDSDLARLETAIENSLPRRVGDSPTSPVPPVAARPEPEPAKAPPAGPPGPAKPVGPASPGPSQRTYAFGLLKNKMQLVAAIGIAAVIVVVVLAIAIGALVAKLDPGLSESALREHVPPGFRNTCETYTPTDDPLQPGFKSGLVCVPGDGAPTQVIYLAYRDPDAASSDYSNWLPTDLGDRDCTMYPGKGVSPRGPTAGGRKRPGSLACYQTRDNTQRVFVWTDESISVIAIASDPKMQIADLYQWWKNSGGPV